MNLNERELVLILVLVYSIVCGVNPHDLLAWVILYTTKG